MSGGTLAAPLAARAARGVSLERAIVQTVAYADVFDYPLTPDEIQRYLIGQNASRATVRSALANTDLYRGALSRASRYLTLAGREAIIDIRRERTATSVELWRRAVRYGRFIGNLPFVRMVAVTGALAMDNVADGDIDYLVVTEPGRLWLCRATVVALVKVAARRGVTLCPNYFLSENALVLEERNLFTAHEVAQMVPLSGQNTYDRLRQLNRWSDRFLPNASGPPRRFAPAPPRAEKPRALAEAAMRSRLGGHLERWEMSRKMRKLSSRGQGHVEAAFDVDWCKGHFGDHGQSTLARYEARMQALEGQLP